MMDFFVFEGTNTFKGMFEIANQPVLQFNTVDSFWQLLNIERLAESMEMLKGIACVKKGNGSLPKPICLVEPDLSNCREIG